MLFCMNLNLSLWYLAEHKYNRLWEQSDEENIRIHNDIARKNNRKMENITKLHNKDIWTLDRGSNRHREMDSAHNTKTVHIRLQMPVHSSCIPLTVLGKVVPVHAMKAYVDSRGISPLILNLSTRWKWVVKFTPWLIYPSDKNL